LGINVRRRLERLIPIVLLAVLVQLMAPIGAFRAVAHAASDPLYLAEICSGASDDGHVLPSNGSTAHDCCVACGAGLAGAVALDAPSSVFVVLQRQYHRVVWLEPLDALPAIRAGSHAQARAPPAFS
jgi:hypothetical protein